MHRCSVLHNGQVFFYCPKIARPGRHPSYFESINFYHFQSENDPIGSPIHMQKSIMWSSLYADLAYFCASGNFHVSRGLPTFHSTAKRGGGDKRSVSKMSV